MSGLVGVSVVACALGNQYYVVSNTVYYAPTTVGTVTTCLVNIGYL